MKLLSYELVGQVFFGIIEIVIYGWMPHIIDEMSVEEKEQLEFRRRRKLYLI